MMSNDNAPFNLLTQSPLLHPLVLLCATPILLMIATESSWKFPKLPKTKGLNMTPLSLHLLRNFSFFLLAALFRDSDTSSQNSCEGAPVTSIATAFPYFQKGIYMSAGVDWDPSQAHPSYLVEGFPTFPPCRIGTNRPQCTRTIDPDPSPVRRLA